MQLPNLVETSFVDTKIPELIWISALFNRADDKAAVNCAVEFQLACREVIACDQFSSLSFLSNFNRLTSDQKNKILSNQACAVWIEKLTSQLWHHHVLLDRYPLSFIFKGIEEFDRKKAIARLRKDVHELFDRRSHHATKVQTTAVVAMMATGKLVINNSIDFLDPNRIFESPDSEDARRVASFVRASLNAGNNFDTNPTISSSWADDFWAQVYKLEGCS